MPAAISSLPPEILLKILSILNPFDLENVAKTLNKHLYNAARPTLTVMAPWVASARRLSSMFPVECDPKILPSYPGHIGPFQTGSHHDRVDICPSDYEPLGLGPGAGPYIYSGPPDLHWMKLDGSFHWLEPLDQETASEMRPHTGVEGDRPLATPRQLELLAKQADYLGVTLPLGFEAFLKSNRLHHRIPSCSAWFFEPSVIVKCPPSIDNGAGGYMLRFHWDQQGCGFAYLYMNTHGDHCVVYSLVDLWMEWNSEIPAEGGERHPGGLENSGRDPDDVASDSFPIAGLTFEEYLVSVYFEELLNFEAEPTQGLKDYVSHVYRNPAELEHLRGRSKSAYYVP